MPTLGYQNGFGDPSQFTRSTQESEVDRFNQYMRSQPFWQQIRGNTTGDFTDSQKNQLQAALQAQGIALPHDFHIDEGGNFNQKSRVKSRILKGAAIGGLALTGVGLAGMGPLAGLHGLVAGSSALPGTGLTAAANGMGGTSLIGAGTIPTVASSNLAGGLITGAGLSGLTGGATTAATGVGSRLASLARNPNVLDAGGRALGAYSQTAASNRGTALDATLDRDQLRLDAEKDRRDSESDAMKKLAQTNYLLGGGPKVSPTNVSILGQQRTLPSFGFGPSAPSDAQKTAAQQLQDELLKRMAGGGFQLTPVDRYMNPGKGERFANILGPALSFGGAIAGRR